MMSWFELQFLSLHERRTRRFYSGGCRAATRNFALMSIRRHCVVIKVASLYPKGWWIGARTAELFLFGMVPAVSVPGR
jgi:hypothetical protein